MSAVRKLLVGIDEAGYGPNLGPLVVVAVSLEVPADVASDSLWERLSSAVRRCSANKGAGTRSLVVDDSKKVYSSGDGLDQLERAALTLIGLDRELPRTLRGLWSEHCLTPSDDIKESPWFDERDVPLPQLVPRDALDESRRSLAATLAQADFARPGIACQIIMPRRFNELVAREDSKSTALFQVNAELLRHIWTTSLTPQIEATLDKHGGRNFYGTLLQQHFNETIVLAGREGAAISQYTVSVGGRQLHATFRPKADSQHLLVAWASMAAKYLRELWMKLFNDYWVERIPGLRPTAGYPVDARRFWDDIRPTADRLGITRAALWRDR